MVYRKSKGVPVGYKEDWKYVGHWGERKVAKGKWRFRFRATKRRRARSYGNFGKGTRGVWYIRGKQYITKTGKGKYQTDFIGTKTTGRFKVRKPRRKYR